MQLNSTATGSTDIIRYFYSSEIMKYSEWIDCSAYSQYYYFIKNLSASDIELNLFISPDKTLSVIDSETLIIKPDETIYLVPLRQSRYVRVGFNNVDSTEQNYIEIWFQAIN
ncbi:MAG TPA: DUF6385 domain-containing protein [Ruminiclostridium sp.]|nr:DUF6385 domain-containing protein [Ruminiclostridium sp.]